MAIAQVNGTSANSGASNVASQATSALSTTTGNDVVVTVALGSTTSSVSSITPSAGSYTSWTLQSSKNGSGIRVEVWTAHVTTGASTIFTVNIAGGNTTCAVCVEQYSGVNSWGNTGSASGSAVNIDGTTNTQQASDWIVGGMAFACQSGDTLTATAGTSRQSTIPAATSVGIALYDQTAVMDETMRLQSRISASRNWAFAAVEMLSGGSAATAGAYGGTTIASLQAARDVRYLHCLEPLFAQNQNYPPTPGANNYGFVA